MVEKLGGILNRSDIKNSTIVLGGDFNHTFFTSDPDSTIGSVGSSAKNISVAKEYEICSALKTADMCISSSFDRNCSEEFKARPFTYTTKDGKSSTVIDYICSNKYMSIFPHSIRHAPEMMVKPHFNDHMPITMRVSIIPVCMSKDCYKRRVASYDKQLIGNLENDTHFSHLIKQFQGVPYHVDNTSHCYVIQNF